MFSVDLMAERLLKFLQSIKDDRVYYDASIWYPNALEEAEGFASGLPIENVVACISALSPQCRWEQNLCWAKRMVNDYVSGNPVTRVSTFQRRDLAWELLATGNVSLLKGNKTRNFYRNIMGDRNAVTIDSHMSYIFTGVERKYTPRQYDICSQATTEVSAYLGITNDITQPWGWLWMRKTRPKIKGYYPWWESLREAQIVRSWFV